MAALLPCTLGRCSKCLNRYSEWLLQPSRRLPIRRIAGRPATGLPGSRARARVHNQKMGIMSSKKEARDYLAEWKREIEAAEVEIANQKREYAQCEREIASCEHIDSLVRDTAAWMPASSDTKRGEVSAEELGDGVDMT